jgi:hypothetical protein
MGVYTDVSEFADNIPENVNIAAGYYRQHTLKETVDTKYVDLIVERMIAMDWTKLPIKRNKGDYSFPAQSWANYAPAATWEDMLDYVQQYPEKVANYLFNVGVDEYEVEQEWAGDVIEDVEIRHGMW